MTTYRTNEELLKLVSKYRELAETLISRSGYTQNEEQMLYYLLQVNDLDRAIEFANK